MSTAAPKKLSQLESDIARDVVKIVKRFPKYADVKVTLVIRPYPESANDLLFCNDDPERAIAAIRSMTAAEVAIAAAQALEAKPPLQPLVEPSTIAEARQEGMGILLGLIDTIHSIAPPEGTSAKAAMNQWGVMLERLASDHYGADWSAFVAACRQTTFGVTGQEQVQ